MTDRTSSPLPCITCGGPVDGPFVGDILAAKRKLGLNPEPPKRCAKCTWTALEGLKDDPKEATDMSKGILCKQDGCRNYAFYRYTWPGKDESAICTEHQPKLVDVASAIGLHLQLIPLTDDEHNNIFHPLARTT